MRWTLVCLFAVLVLAATSALAGTPEDPEVEDSSGDAGVEGHALTAGGEDFDILAAWFATNETGTWAHLELASFEVHPEDVVFSVDAGLSEERWIGVGYGSYILPFPPFRSQGFQGCTGPGDRGPNCTKLAGEMLDERAGFAVRIPASWIEDEPRLREPTARVAAYTMWPAVSFDEAGPGEAYPLDTNTSNDTGEDEITPSASDGVETTGEDEARLIPTTGLAGAILAASCAILLRGRSASGRRRGARK